MERTHGTHETFGREVENWRTRLEIASKMTRVERVVVTCRLFQRGSHGVFRTEKPSNEIILQKDTQRMELTTQD